MNSGISHAAVPGAARPEPVTSDVSAGEFWEPWQPQIGDRVQVRLSRECRAQFSRAAVHGDLAIVITRTRRGHYPMEDGNEGVVEAIVGRGVLAEYQPVDGHYYAVRYTRDSHKIGAYAAIELEPLEPRP